MNTRLLTLLGVTLTALSAMAAITPREAARLAQDHVKSAPKGPMAICVTPDLDDGRLQYDVRFHDGAYAYECEVDAETGAILDSESKKLPEVAGFPETPKRPRPEGRRGKARPTPDAAPAPKAGGLLTAEEAKAVAFGDLGIADAKRVKVKRDRDDGRDEYEIEFVSDDTEHDYTIDARTGDIISHESEPAGWF